MSNTSKQSTVVPATETQELEKTSQDELSNEALEKVSGGVKRTGPGTQTEDDIYVG